MTCTAWFLKDFLATSTACAFANVVTHPLETIKVRQVLHVGHCPSTISLLFSISRSEGVLALYKGLSPAILRAVISGGGRLTGYNYLKDVSYKSGFLPKNGAVLDAAVRS